MLEVPHAAVDQTRRAARRAGGEVLPLDERDRESAARRITRDPRAGDPAADHEQIEVPIGELVEAARTAWDRLAGHRRDDTAHPTFME